MSAPDEWPTAGACRSGEFEAFRFRTFARAAECAWRRREPQHASLTNVQGRLGRSLTASQAPTPCQGLSVHTSTARSTA